MAGVRLATLLTDFGTTDPYVAAMKGVILRRCPGATLVDICHDIKPHDIAAGAFVLAQAAPCFPPGTLHIVVVDPGVGTDRRILAASFGGQLFLVPDNGVISMIAATMPLEEIVSVRNTKYVSPENASMTFQGRDIFAPIAGHVLNGLRIDRLGPQPETYKLLDFPDPREESAALVGEVAYVDHFGNLISNISQHVVHKHWDNLSTLRVSCAGQEVGLLHGTYGFVEPQQPVALFNSMDLLEIAVNQGSAADFFNTGRGAEVRVVGGAVSEKT